MLSRVSSCWSRSPWTAGFHSPAPAYPWSRHGISVHLVAAILILLNVCTGILPQPSFTRLGLSVAHAGNVQYVYDDLGRLIAVVDVTTNEAAIYQYDAVGNLLGIVRQPASTVSILNFTPKSGPIGTTVMIAGMGYSTTASQNTVTFNGTPATVSSATATQLVVTVPTGATTGPITVTTPTGSATSSTPFTVTSGGVLGAPTITSFTPTIGTIGTAVSISGANFASTPAHNSVRFNIPQALVTTATPTTLTTTVPAGATSGRIRVATPLGVAVSPTDFFVPPSPYTAADVDSTGRIAFGESKTMTVSIAAHIGLLVFDGSANQRVSVVVNTSTIGNCVNGSLKVLTPDGTTLGTTSVCAGKIVGPLTLPVSGTYTIVADPYTTNTGQVTLTLHDVVDVTGTLTIGAAPTGVTITTPGQTASLTFTGTASQQVTVRVTGNTISSVTVKLLKPDGTTQTSSTSSAASFNLAQQTLATTGTYTVLVDPPGVNTGSLNVQVTSP